MELSSQIRKFRTEKGMSQGDLARAIFVSRQTICNWETDKTYPDVQSILLLSQVFDVSTDELIKGDIATMRRRMADDAITMKWMAIGMIVLIFGAIICFVSLAALWRAPTDIGALTMGELVGAALFAVFYIAGMSAAVRIERIKSAHDLVTYREITDFYNGRIDGSERDGHGFSRAHPVLTVVAKLLASAAAGAFVGIVVYMAIW